MNRFLPLAAAIAACILLPAAPAGVSAALPLWPSAAPDPNPVTGPEGETSTAASPKTAGAFVSRIGNVSVPTLTVYSPTNPHGTAVVVCPGGGYKILAIDLEGTELCDWLNSLGVTAILLKYRVPDAGPYPAHAAALDDAQRAMGLVRLRAAEWHVDPSKVGILGFSAGAHLAAVLSTHWRTRIYARVDAADDLSCRPDFAWIIYPGYIVDPDRDYAMNPSIPVDKETPPAFLVQAMNDHAHVEGAIAYALACKKAGVPAELHVYPTGGHGYGIRKTKEPITSWNELAAQWLAARGLAPRSP